VSVLNEIGASLISAARAQATWELEASRTILADPRRIALLMMLLLPIAVGSVVFADQLAGASESGAAPDLPSMIGGKEAYSPAFYSTFIFVASILIGLAAGLITGCIGAGGGFIITPALMSAGVKGILAVGTDLFHIFAKAIMGSVIHRKLGNVSVPLAATFLIGSMAGATVGGILNRTLYEINPVLSDAFITTIYAIILGGLGAYALRDFLKSRRNAAARTAPRGSRAEGVELGDLPRRLQAMNLPPMITFDESLVPGGRRISAWFLIASGFLVGLAAAIMGVGGGFLTFPIFVYTLGVSSMTTVGTDIFQIVFTAGYAAISQYAIYGFIFYTLAMGMLIGSLLGVQLGALVTKVVEGITIRGFYAMAVLAGFVNRIFALPGKLADLEVLPLSKATAGLLDAIGIWAFFLIIGGFTVWVIGTFVKNTAFLRGKEVTP
jgi:uncharacterized membrane protein YfcA